MIGKKLEFKISMRIMKQYMIIVSITMIISHCTLINKLETQKFLKSTFGLVVIKSRKELFVKKILIL